MSDTSSLARRDENWELVIHANDLVVHVGKFDFKQGSELIRLLGRSIVSQRASWVDIFTRSIPSLPILKLSTDGDAFTPVDSLPTKPVKRK